MRADALAILDHVLNGGFIDESTGFIRGYRVTTTGEMALNYKHNSEWFCPGSMAKIAFQLLIFADKLGNDPRAEQMRSVAVKTADWIRNNVDSVPNGWFPRRTTSEGKLYMKRPWGDDDPFWQTSADGIFIIQLQAALTERGLADYTEQVSEKVGVFIDYGGIFGSINHDTYDPHENVAYSVAFRTLMSAYRVLNDDGIRTFAYETCLKGLDRFKMMENRNGVATKGLLYMEETWDTAYMWENAEASLAFFEAAVETRTYDPQLSREYEIDGLVILRAAANHHYGPYGFLSEGIDWHNIVGQEHHINQTEFAAIRYTEPFLNNQHITEPTLYYLEHLAKVTGKSGEKQWYDIEGNCIYSN
ncbi:hypothetical protein ES708_33876 [subsurface metagenome]